MTSSVAGSEGNPHRFIGDTAERAAGVGNKLGRLPREVKLALEMSVNEDTERAALEGELEVLEAAWKEAEEIAAIADDMFLPKYVVEFMRKHGRG